MPLMTSTPTTSMALRGSSSDVAAPVPQIPLSRSSRVDPRNTHDLVTLPIHGMTKATPDIRSARSSTTAKTRDQRDHPTPRSTTTTITTAVDAGSRTTISAETRATSHRNNQPSNGSTVQTNPLITKNANHSSQKSSTVSATNTITRNKPPNSNGIAPNPSTAMLVATVPAAPMSRGASSSKQRHQTLHRGHRLDRYGFIVNMDDAGVIHPTLSPSSDVGSRREHASAPQIEGDDAIPTFRQAQRNALYSEQWQLMMSRWPRYSPASFYVRTGSGGGALAATTTTTTSSAGAGGLALPKVKMVLLGGRGRSVLQTRGRARRGIPEAQRGAVWQHLGRVSTRMKAAVASTPPGRGRSSSSASPPPLTYAQLVQSCPQRAAQHASIARVHETIERDIHRTFPRHYLFYNHHHHQPAPIDNAAPSRRPSSGPSGGGGGVLQTLLLHPHSTRSSRTHETRTNAKKTALGTTTPSDDNDPDSAPITDLAHRGDADDLHGVMCGAEEISNMIRELESYHTMSPQLPRLEASASGASLMATTTTGPPPTNCRPPNGYAGNGARRTSSPTIAPAQDPDPLGVDDDKIYHGIGDHDEDDINYSEGEVEENAYNETTTPNNSSQYGIDTISPSHSQLTEYTDGQASLRRILKAYSLYDRHTGYCQGMNFIAAMFLTVMPEEESFWLLVAVMNDEPCRMRGLFGEGMSETHMVLHIADRLIQQFLPKLAHHFQNEHIHITMFATQWLLTQYTSSFRFDLVTRVWDSFLIEGWKVTYRVMLSLLSECQSTLLSMSFEEILAFFRDLPELVDGATIVDAAFRIPLRRKHIHKYELEWKAQQAQHQP